MSDDYLIGSKIIVDRTYTPSRRADLTIADEIKRSVWLISDDAAGHGGVERGIIEIGCGLAQMGWLPIVIVPSQGAMAQMAVASGLQTRVVSPSGVRAFGESGASYRSMCVQKCLECRHYQPLAQTGQCGADPMCGQGERHRGPLGQVCESSRSADDLELSRYESFGAHSLQPATD